MNDRMRLSLQFTAIAATLLALFAISLYVWVRDRLEQEMRRDLEARQRTLHGFLLDEYDEVRRGVHPDLAAELLEYAQVSGFRLEVRRGDGTLVAATGGFAPPTPAPWEIQVESDRLRVVEGTIRATDGQEFRTVLAISARSQRRQLTRLIRFYLAFGPPALALAWLMGFLFVGRTLAPVEALRARAERIHRENLSERVPVPVSAGEIRRLALTLNAMLERLDRDFRELQAFTGDAAHELRTPLANLRALIETSIQHPLSGADAERVLASAHEEVDRLQRIVNNLLFLAQVDAREFSFAITAVPLQPLLEEAREIWQASAEAADIRIRVDGEAVTARADATALRRVLMNLVENAVKYNRPGGSVVLSSVARHPSARLRVRDTGHGIAADQLPRVFDRFYRADPARSRETGGAGLGLAICRSVVERLGGTIVAASRLGDGTEVIVDLPLDGDPAAGA